MGDALSWDLARSVAHREVFGPSPELATALSSSPLAARHLTLEATLRGHRGCVNRLAWNEAGTLLASGSDDRRVLLWSFPDHALRPPVRLETQHTGNIFGTRILPHSGDRLVITGAMDYEVQLHRLDATPAGAAASPRAAASSPASSGGSPAAGAAAAVEVPVQTTEFKCHRGRVKGVEADPTGPNVFWSASEDGMIRQFDVRLPTASQDSYGSANVLLTLRGCSGAGSRQSRDRLEVKAMAVNSVRPDEVAVAAGDRFVRVYDRRRLVLAPPAASAARADAPLLAAAPPHLCIGAAAWKHTHSTHVAWGRRGDKVVANYHGDHSYVFDTTSAAGPPTATLRSGWAGRAGGAGVRGSDSAGRRGSSLDSLPSNGMPAMLPQAAERAASEAELCLANGQLSEAVRQYGRALRAAPAAAPLRASRAMALLRRGWAGDAAAALADCEAALEVDPGCMRSQYRRAQALTAAGLLRAARAACALFRARFPSGAEDIGRVEAQVEADVAEQAKRADMRRRQAEQRRLNRRRRGLDFMDRLRSRRGGEEAGEGEGAAGSPGAGGSRSGEASEAPGLGGSRSSEGSEREEEEEEEEGGEEEGRSGGGADAALAAEVDERYAAALEREGLGVVDGMIGPPPPQPAPSLAALLPGGHRLLQRYVGQCNVQTDIKEAVFVGDSDSFVACGSDDGRVLIFDAASGELLAALDADADVANCIAPHPSLPLLATGGIGSSVKLWSPGAAAAAAGGERSASRLEEVVRANQDRMRTGPSFFRGLDPRILAALAGQPGLLQTLGAQIVVPLAADAGGEEGDAEGEEGEEGIPIPEVSCRVA